MQVLDVISLLKCFSTELLGACMLRYRQLLNAKIRSRKHIWKPFSKGEATLQHILMSHKFFKNTKTVQGFTFSNRFAGEKKHEALFHE